MGTLDLYPAPSPEYLLAATNSYVEILLKSERPEDGKINHYAEQGQFNL
jgi:hypothetical protein